MFGKRQAENSLEPPPVAQADKQAVEVLRVWAAPGKPQELVLRTTWKDPAAWGLMLADIANHASRAYEAEGHNRAEVLARIRAGLAAEWSSPTDPSS